MFRNQTSVATSKRINSERGISGVSTVADKKASIRPDLVLVSNGFEYGCSEVGKSLSAIPDKKEIIESQLHSPKTMKDMLSYAIAETKHDPEVMRKLKIVGFSQTGMILLSEV